MGSINEQITVNIELIDVTISLIKLSGEMDAHNAPAVKSQIDTAMSNNGTNKIIFNLSQVEYIDSTGISLLVSTYKHTSDIGGMMCLLTPSQRVERLLQISGLNKYFPVFELKEDAVAFLTNEDK